MTLQTIILLEEQIKLVKAELEQRTKTYETLLAICQGHKKKLDEIKELLNNIDVSELDSVTIDILNEINTILEMK